MNIPLWIVRKCKLCGEDMHVNLFLAGNLTKIRIVLPELKSREGR